MVIRIITAVDSSIKMKNAFDATELLNNCKFIL